MSAEALAAMWRMLYAMLYEGKPMLVREAKRK
jgi:hypothetical protein